MDFKPRLVIPEKNNKYYNRAPEGYGTSIQGYPLQSGLTCLSNCVGYAAARFNEIGGYNCWKYFNYPPNGRDFVKVAKEQGLKVGFEPKLGAIMCWGGAGNHVAVVEQIISDEEVVTSNSAYGGDAFYLSTRKKGNGNWHTKNTFLGFIYQPEDQPVVPSRTLVKGMHGGDVKQMQTKLAEHGYLRQNEIDGSFGTITLGALLAFQFENGLEVDGRCGPMTKKKLGM